MKAKALGLFALLLCVAPLPPSAAQGESSLEERATVEGSSARGSAIFHRYCRSCHGKTGIGDGQVAEFLKVPPADLTLLAAENGGEFPADRVLRSIDGRDQVRLHGRDMPIWGSVFQADAGRTEADAQQNMADTIAYLRRMQVEGSAGESETEE